MKATLNDTVLAEAEQDDLIKIEGNWYFPPASLKKELFESSDTPYTCPWKGEAQYWNVRVGDDVHADKAWSYPTPYDGAASRVGKDFAGYVAFDPSVTIAP
jgi:uncharacterized protein (DUF427 family)